MTLEILSAEEKVYSGEVESVIFPGSEGEFQILNNHAPLISSLKNGTIKYSSNKKIHSLEVSGGIVEVLNNNCLLYTSPSPRDRQKSRMASCA